MLAAIASRSFTSFTREVPAKSRDLAGVDVPIDIGQTGARVDDGACDACGGGVDDERAPDIACKRIQDVGETTVCRCWVREDAERSRPPGCTFEESDERFCAADVSGENQRRRGCSPTHNKPSGTSTNRGRGDRSAVKSFRRDVSLDSIILNAE